MYVGKTTRGRPRARHVAVLAVATVLGSLVALSAPARAADDETSDVETLAEVTNGGGGTSPSIECSWAIPDQDNTANGFQYAPPYDDDNALQDAVANPPNGAPCAWAGPGQRPVQADGATRMIQVRPYAHDENAGGPESNPIQTKPGQVLPGRLIEVWVAVDPPSSGGPITAVSADIYHPDGSPKLQVYGDPVACTVGNPDPRLVPGGAMWTSALRTGQVASDAITNADGRGMYQLCQQGTKHFYRIAWPISKEQMCGQYRVVVKANSAGGADTLTFALDVLCFIHLEIDFGQVNFGALTPPADKIVDGNFTWGDGVPSVRNTGNSGMRTGVRFHRMDLLDGNGNPVPAPLDKHIYWFDAKFNKNPSAGPESIDVTAPDTPPYHAEGWFGTAPDQVLCANQVGKLDLSVHVPAGQEFGQYRGRLVVLGNSARAVCPNDNFGDFSDD